MKIYMIIVRMVIWEQRHISVLFSQTISYASPLQLWVFIITVVIVTTIINIMIIIVFTFIINITTEVVMVETRTIKYGILSCVYNYTHRWVNYRLHDANSCDSYDGDDSDIRCNNFRIPVEAHQHLRYNSLMLLFQFTSVWLILLSCRR